MYQTVCNARDSFPGKRNLFLQTPRSETARRKRQFGLDIWPMFGKNLFFFWRGGAVTKSKCNCNDIISVILCTKLLEKVNYEYFFFFATLFTFAFLVLELFSLNRRYPCINIDEFPLEGSHGENSPSDLYHSC